MIDEKFALLTIPIGLTGISAYIVATLRGKTQPNRITWFLWAVAPLLAFLIQLDEGVGLSSTMTFMVGLGPLLVVLASFHNKNAFWKLGVFDYGCGVLSVLAFSVWLLFQNGTLGVALLIATDLLAAVPTLTKLFSHPSSEMPWAYIGGGTNGIITLLTLDGFSIIEAGFPAYILAINFVLVTLIISGPHRGSAMAVDV